MNTVQENAELFRMLQSALIEDKFLYGAFVASIESAIKELLATHRQGMCGKENSGQDYWEGRMKVRVTLMTENDKPVSALGENPEKELKRGWELFCALLNMQSDDRATLERVEIVE